MDDGKKPLLEIRNVSKHYGTSNSWFERSSKQIHALEDVSLTVYGGETLGLVGESGSGKTTLGRLAVRLLEPTSGSVHFQGKDVAQLKDKEMREQRKHMQIIFQDPLASLNPRKTIRKILRQPFLTYGILDKKEAEDRAKELLEQVGLSPPELYMDRYPHQLSGGQRQRICIANAIALKPKLIVADEPVSALDISVRNQILNLMIKLKKELGLTYIFISHDLNVIRALCDRVAVMHRGKIVEMSTIQEIFERPSHPYTIALISSVLPTYPR
ncbi:MAG: ATP-binding cassette domain-containing protein [Nitrososphaera sp.]